MNSTSRRRGDIARLEAAQTQQQEAPDTPTGASQRHHTPQPPATVSRPSTKQSGRSTSGPAERARSVALAPPAQDGAPLITVVHMRGGTLECPLCGQLELDVLAFKQHIFDCRISLGIDPLLPLTVVRPVVPQQPQRLEAARAVPHPPPGAATSASTPRGGGTASTGTGGRTAGTSSARRATSSRRSASMGGMPSSKQRNSASRAALQAILGCPPPPSVPVGSARPRWSAALSAPNGNVPSTVAHSTGPNGADDIDRLLRPIGSGVERIELFEGRSAAPMPAPKDKPKRPPPIAFTDSKVSQDVQYFLSLPPEEASVLTLSDVHISVRDAKLLHSAIGDWQLVVGAIDFTGATAITSEAEHLVVRAIMRNRYVNDVRLADCGFRRRLEAPAVADHLRVNERRREHSERAAEFNQCVRAFRAAEATARTQYTAMSDDERAGRRELGAEESDARTGLCHSFERSVLAIERRLSRREVARAAASERSALFDKEAESRDAGCRLFVSGLLQLLVQVEGAIRADMATQKDYERIDIKRDERKEVFEAKSRERARLQDEHEARVAACADELMARSRLRDGYQRGFEVIAKQFERGHAYQHWLQRQRDDVANLLKFQGSVRDGLLKEEANVFSSQREKFAATIKGVLAKYASQREDIETGERATREHYQFNFESLLEFEVAVFRVKTKLHRLREKAQPRLRLRRELLDTPPEVRVSLCDEAADEGPFRPPIFVMPAAGQDVRPPMPLAASSRVTASMGQDWVQKLQETEVRCKQLLVEERALFSEVLPLLFKQAPAANRARNFVLGLPLVTAPETPPSSHAASDSGGGGGDARSDRDGDEEAVPCSSSASVAASACSDGEAADVVWATAAPYPQGFSRGRGGRPPSAPTSDPAFVAARDDMLRFRCAWHDTASATAIAAAKEAVIGGVALFRCDREEESEGGVRYYDQLCTSQCEVLTCTYDGAAHEDVMMHRAPPPTDEEEAPPAALIGPVPATAAVVVTDESATNENERSTTSTASPPPRRDSDGSRLKVAASSGRGRSASMYTETDTDDDEQDRHDKTGGDDGDADEPVEIGDGVPEYPAAVNVLEVRMQRPEKELLSPLASPESNLGLTHFVKRPYIPKATIAQLVSCVEYRCRTTEPEPLLPVAAGQHAATTADTGGARAIAPVADRAVVRPIRYRLNFVFPRRDEYCVSQPSADKYGYVPLTPSHVSASGDDTLSTVVDGTLIVGVTPSVLRLPEGQPMADDRVFVEMQKEDMPLLPPIAAITEPARLVVVMPMASSSPAAEVLPPDPTTTRGYAGALVKVELFGLVCADDRLSIKDDMAVQVRTTDLTTYNVRSIAVHGSTVCSVESGTLQVTRQVRQANGPGVRPYVALRFAGGPSQPDVAVLGEAVRAVISRLHYHNTATEGIRAGARKVRITVETAEKADVVIFGRFEVEEIDAPTEIVLAHNEYVMRQPLSVAAPREAVRDAVLTPLVAIAHRCIVFDEDTDRFGGGHIHLYLRSSSPGDGLAICAGIHMVNPVYAAVASVEPMRIDDDGAVFYEDRVVATVERAKVLRSPGDEAQGEPEDEVKLLLSGDDECSIAAVECILRHVVFYNCQGTAGAKGHQPNGAARDVVFDVEIGDGEQACNIPHVVQVKPAGSTLQIAEKATSIDLKEACPATRFGPLDTGLDRIVPVNSFAGGWILCSVATGFEEGDTLALREDMDYKLVAPVTGALLASGRARKISTDMTRKLETQFRNRCEKGLFCSAGWGGTDIAAAVLDKKQPQLNALELALPGVKEPAGIVTWHGGGRHLLVQFYAEAKGATAATKKLATSIMRNFTYQHQVPDPQVTSKALRVCCCDQPSHTFSEALIAAEIELVDDVTQIVLAKPRRRFRVGSEPYALFPHGQAILQDDDTDFFDAGHLLVSLSGTSLKERLVLRKPQEQFWPAGTVIKPDLTTPLFDDVVFTDTEVLVGSDGEGAESQRRVAATIVRGGKENASAEIKLVFPPLPPDFEGDGGLMSIELASFLLNCVCVEGDGDRAKDAVRTVNARIRDAENPVDGKVKFTLDASPGLLVPSASAAAATSIASMAESSQTPPAASIRPSGSLIAAGPLRGPAILRGSSGQLFKGTVSLGPALEKPPAQGFFDVFLDTAVAARFGATLHLESDSGAYVFVPEVTDQAAGAGGSGETPPLLPPAPWDRGTIVFKEKDKVASVSPLPAAITMAEEERAPEKASEDDEGAGTSESGGSSAEAGQPVTVAPRTGFRVSWSSTSKLKITKAHVNALLLMFRVRIPESTDAGAPTSSTAADPASMLVTIAVGDVVAPDGFSRVAVEYDVLAPK